MPPGEVPSAVKDPSQGSVPRITLYSRQYCHLCAEMLQALQAIRVDLCFDLEVIDVDTDPELEVRYGERVPVLALGERTICHYHLDVAKLRASLS